jgi:hypothetical protein
MDLSHHPSWKTRLKARVLGHAIDQRLLEGAEPSSDEVVAARLEILVSRGYRAGIADALRRMAAAARPEGWRPFELVSRPDVHEMNDELLQLACELEQRDDAKPRGVILASRLITDGDVSPAYWPTSPAALEAWIKHARAALSLG